MTRALALAAALAALALAGCGGDDDEPGPARTDPAPAPTAPATTGEESGPTATTGEPPGARRGPPPGELAGEAYTCEGRELRAIAPDGPVRVQPPVVEPGESFAVEVTDPDAGVALVSLAGVADEPISAEAERSGGRLRATLRMPRDASCGNKLITVEGDVSAQAYVAVRR